MSYAPNENLSYLTEGQIPHTVLKFKEGETIFEPGEERRGLYLLKSGCVKMCLPREIARGRTTTSEYVTKLIGPDEAFGYKGMAATVARRASATAVKDCEIWLYSTELVQDVLKKANPLMQLMLSQSIVDTQNYQRMSKLHYLASVQERIAYQLVLVADRFGVASPEGLRINLKLTRNELAQLAGTINESLSRHLTEFKNEGLIDINGREIIIKDRDALAAKSGNFVRIGNSPA